MSCIDRSLERFETGVLNPVGCFPVVCIPSAAVRLMLATAEVIVGIAIVAFGFLALCNHTLLKTGTWYICHGIANGFRSAVEFTNILCCWNPILRSYDLRHERFSYLPFEILAQRPPVRRLPPLEILLNSNRISRSSMPPSQARQSSSLRAEARSATTLGDELSEYVRLRQQRQTPQASFLSQSQPPRTPPAPRFSASLLNTPIRLAKQRQTPQASLMPSLRSRTAATLPQQSPQRSLRTPPRSSTQQSQQVELSSFLSRDTIAAIPQSNQMTAFLRYLGSLVDAVAPELPHITGNENNQREFRIFLLDLSEGKEYSDNRNGKPLTEMQLIALRNMMFAVVNTLHIKKTRQENLTPYYPLYRNFVTQLLLIVNNSSRRIDIAAVTTLVNRLIVEQQRPPQTQRSPSSLQSQQVHIRRRKVEPPILPEVTFEKGPRFIEKREVLNWKKDDPLFNTLYVTALYTSINDDELVGHSQQIQIIRANLKTDSNRQTIQQAHEDLNNINRENRVKLVNFLYILMTCEKLRNYSMDKPNTDRLRQAILAIFNTLHARKAECKTAKDRTAFYAIYNTVITQLMEALTHCSNAVNSNVEDLLHSIIRRETTLEGSILLALQKYRHDLLVKAVKSAIGGSGDEASTVSYYFRILGNQFGLPPTLSALDKNFESFATKNKDQEILSYFGTHYTPDAVVRVVHKIINDPQNPEIPTQRFTDWVSENFGERRAECIDDDGIYKAEVVAAALKHFKIITVTADPQKKIQPFELVSKA